jgi:amino acid adenylation domain-containing protein
MAEPVESKREQLLRLLRERSRNPAHLNAEEPLTAGGRGETIPLSYAQERLWVLDRIRPGGHNNILAQFELKGPIDLDALKRGVESMIARHEILRTTFPVIDGVPRQRISPPTACELPLLDLLGLPAMDRGAALGRAIAAQGAVQFDLESGPLLKCTLISLEAQHHVLIVSIHHLLADGWSFALIFKELAKNYDAHARGSGAGLPPPLTIQYADFAQWQRRTLNSARQQRALDYWKRQLAGPILPLDLPFDRRPMAARSIEGGMHSLTLDHSLQSELRSFSRSEGVTLYTTLLTALNILLLRFTGQEDIAVGTVIAERPTAATEDMVGLFLNTLVLRTNYSGDPELRTALQRTRDTVLQSQEHAEYPFYALVNELRPERDPDRSPFFHSPFFDVIFNMQSFEAEGEIEAAGLHIRKLSAADYYTAADTLTVYAYDGRDNLELLIGYNRDLFDQVTVERLGRHMTSLLGSIVRHPLHKLSRLPMFGEAERTRLLSMSRGPRIEVPVDLGYAHYFKQQTDLAPGAIAVSDGAATLSYSELNAESDRVAQRLRADGDCYGRPVGLCARSGITLLSSILGIFKAGAAYLPFDPRYPVARYTAMLRQSRVGTILVAEEFLPVMQMAVVELPPEQRPQLLQLPAVLQKINDLPAEKIDIARDALAYVIFTSGSTGTPKGAMVPQAAMLNHLWAKIRMLDLVSKDRVLQSAPIGFDVSVWQMLAPLLAGATVLFPAAEIAADPTLLFSYIEQNAVTVAQVVPSFLRSFLDAVEGGLVAPLGFQRLRVLALVGEALPPELTRRWFNRWPHVSLVNGYGPTECADEASRQPLQSPPADNAIRVSIGKPIDNARLYVLDRHGGLLPIGAAGELCIGGAGVGAGYLNDITRTEASFKPDPYNEVDVGARMYRTGDRGRLCSDGTFEFLGRLDFQVKIRGQRVELGEIESQLGSLEAVRQAAVHPWQTERGERLAAYVIPRDPLQPPSAEQLRAHLAAVLPGYMVPDQFIILRAMPLNANGKIDRRALPAPGAAPEEEFVAPRSAMETLVARVWSDILGRSRIGARDNFFDLGGHSLLAAQAAASFRNELKVEIGLRALFEQRTLADLANHLESAQKAELSREEFEL